MIKIILPNFLLFLILVAFVTILVAMWRKRSLKKGGENKWEKRKRNFRQGRS